MRNWSLAERVLHELRVDTTGIDATRLIPGLWMGSKPETGNAVSEAGMDLLVLCAEEYQPPASSFPGVKVIHAPFDDTDIKMFEGQQATAKAAGKQVADALRAGANVLVTCWAGRNRSGLVCALAMVDCKLNPLRAIRLIQRYRKQALTNESFVALIAGSM